MPPSLAWGAQAPCIAQGMKSPIAPRPALAIDPSHFKPVYPKWEGTGA
jgi:hypothetical protein